MEVAGAIVAVVVGLFVVLLISTAFLLWGAGIAGIEQRTFGKALGVTVLGGIASGVLSLILSVLPVIGMVLGFIGGFFVTALILMPIFSTTFGKALVATVLAWVLSLVVIGGILLLGFAMFGSLAAIL